MALLGRVQVPSPAISRITERRFVEPKSSTTRQLVVAIGEDDVGRALSHLVAVRIAGVAHELQLPLGVQTTRHHVIIAYREEEWPIVLEAKEDFRAALMRRNLDIMLVRKIMRLIFATTIEEP